MSHPTMAMPLKNTDRPYCGYQLSVAPHPGLGSCNPFPILAGMLTGFILCKSCTVNRSLWESWVQHPGQIKKALFAVVYLVLCQSFNLSMSPEPWGEEVCYRYPIEDGLYSIIIIYALWPTLTTLSTFSDFQPYKSKMPKYINFWVIFNN